MDDLTLVNRALNEIGQVALTSLDNTTNNDTIATALLHLESIKRAALRAHDWNCARTRKVLTLVGAVDDNGSLGEWKYAYRIPPDCLAVRRFVSNVTEIRYAKFSVEIDSEDKRILYTTNGNDKIVYTKDLLDVNRWDALLADACVTRLAGEFAMAIPHDLKLAAGLWEAYEKKKLEAEGVDDAESGVESVYGDDLVSVRW